MNSVIHCELVPMKQKYKNKMMIKMEFKGDIIITDPCYIIKEDSRDDWSRCNYGDRMNDLGITNYLCRDTIYGDWICNTYNNDTKESMGEFCADAGLVSVFLLDEVLKYNPNFDYHINRPWTTTLIKDFDGEINISVVPYEYEYENDDGEKVIEKDEEVRVIGTGNINFFTSQTGM